MTVVCALQYLWGSFDQDALLRLGANMGRVVASGQWPRLLTASWLHVGALHLFVTVATLAWSRPLESKLGRTGWTLVFAGSALVGTALQGALEPDSPAVTGSAGAAGVLAAAAWLSRRPGAAHWRLPVVGVRGGWALVTVLQCVALAVPGGGLVAPLCGAAAGLALAAVLPRDLAGRAWAQGLGWLWLLATASAFEWLWSVTRPWTR